MTENGRLIKEAEKRTGKPHTWCYRCNKLLDISGEWHFAGLEYIHLECRIKGEGILWREGTKPK